MGMCVCIGWQFENGNICFPMVRLGLEDSLRKLLSRDPTISHRDPPSRNRALVHARLPTRFLCLESAVKRWVMTVYALAANLPCILAQCYPRLELNRIARAQCRTFVRLWTNPHRNVSEFLVGDCT